MKNLALILMAVLTVHVAMGQVAVWENYTFEKAIDAAIDEQNNVYEVFQVPGANQRETVIRKVDPSGNVIWQESVIYSPSNLVSIPVKIVCRDQKVYVMANTVDGPPPGSFGMCSSYEQQLVVDKRDASSGSQLNFFTYKPNASYNYVVRGRDLVVDDLGNMFVTGYTGAQCSPNNILEGHYSWFTARLNKSTGNIMWENTETGTYVDLEIPIIDKPFRIFWSSNNDIYVGGEVINTHPDVGQKKDIRLVRYNYDTGSREALDDVTSSYAPDDGFEFKGMDMHPNGGVAVAASIFDLYDPANKVPFHFVADFYLGLKWARGFPLRGDGADIKFMHNGCDLAFLASREKPSIPGSESTMFVVKTNAVNGNVYWTWEENITPNSYYYEGIISKKLVINCNEEIIAAGDGYYYYNPNNDIPNLYLTKLSSSGNQVWSMDSNTFNPFAGYLGVRTLLLNSHSDILIQAAEPDFAFSNLLKVNDEEVECPESSCSSDCELMTIITDDSPSLLDLDGTFPTLNPSFFTSDFTRDNNFNLANWEYDVIGNAVVYGGGGTMVASNHTPSGTTPSSFFISGRAPIANAPKKVFKTQISATYGQRYNASVWLKNIFRYSYTNTGRQPDFYFYINDVLVHTVSNLRFEDDWVNACFNFTAFEEGELEFAIAVVGDVGAFDPSHSAYFAIDDLYIKPYGIRNNLKFSTTDYTVCVNDLLGQGVTISVPPAAYAYFITWTSLTPWQPNAIGPTVNFNPNVVTQYRVTMTDIQSGCSVNQVITITPVECLTQSEGDGLVRSQEAKNSEQLGIDYEVYPNPFVETLTVTLPDDGTATSAYLIEILNAQGQRVGYDGDGEVFSAGRHSLVLPNQLPKGLYLLRITDKNVPGKTPYVTRVVKQ